MFQKIVVIEPVSFTSSAREALKQMAKAVTFYDDIPSDNREIIKRIGDADAVLLSYTSRIDRDVIDHCPSIKYIGMCCSLYSPESANVDIRHANSKGIEVTGIRDYGDQGVIEYVISELVRCLHGFGQPAWDKTPREITGLHVGILGLGTSGGMIADAMNFFGAHVSYFARSEKAYAKEKGYRFLPLPELLSTNEVVCCCLNRNTILLHEEEFNQLGNHKILFNTSISPTWEPQAFSQWLDGDNLCFCDTIEALGGTPWLQHPHVRCMQVSSGGCTQQAFARLSKKVIDNLLAYDRQYNH